MNNFVRNFKASVKMLWFLVFLVVMFVSVGVYAQECADNSEVVSIAFKTDEIDSQVDTSNSDDESEKVVDISIKSLETGIAGKDKFKHTLDLSLRVGEEIKVATKVKVRNKTDVTVDNVDIFYRVDHAHKRFDRGDTIVDSDKDEAIEGGDTLVRRGYMYAKMVSRDKIRVKGVNGKEEYFDVEDGTAKFYIFADVIAPGDSDISSTDSSKREYAKVEVSLDTTPPPKPDLTITNIRPSGEFTEFGVQWFIYTIKNVGNQSFNSSIQTRVSITGRDNKSYYDRETVNLKPGESKDFRVSAFGLNRGPHDVTMDINIHKVQEKNFANNSKTWHFAVFYYDVEAVLFSGEVINGNKFRFKYDIRNNSNKAVNLSVNYYLDGVYKGRVNTWLSNSQKRYMESQEFWSPNTLGFHEIKVCVQTYKDFNSANDCSVARLLVKEPPRPYPIGSTIETMRFYHSKYGHLFSIYTNDLNKLPKMGWAYHGKSFRAFTRQVPGSVPVYALWIGNGHRYSRTWHPGAWVAFWAYPTNGNHRKPIYEMKKGAHYILSNGYNDMLHLKSMGWRVIQIPFYAPN